MWPKVRQWINQNEALILLVVFSIILRIPSWFEPYWYGDEGIYLTLGEAIKNGMTLYRDIHDNKPPLLYVLAALTGTVFWFRVLLTFWFGAAVVVFAALVKKMLPNRPKAWKLATILMIVLTTIFEGNIANAEIFITLPVLLGLYLAWQAKTSWWLIGVLFAVGFLFKAPAAFDFWALLLWLVFWQRTRIKNVLAYGLGFGIPAILSIVYYAYQGAFTPYVRSALMQNIGYLASWSTGEHSSSGFASQSGLIIRFLGAAIGSFVFYFVSRRTRLSRGASLTILWFVWALFAALLSERPYPHYLVQPAVPLAILLTFFCFGGRRLLRLILLAIFITTGVAYYQIRFWSYPIFSYYTNFVSYTLGQKSTEDYRAYFDSRVNQTYRLAEYIRQTTTADDRIFIWGDEPYIYALSNRLPVGRYTVAYHVVDFNGWEETTDALDSKKPPVIIVMDYELRQFPNLKTQLATDYVLTAVIDQAKIYRRIFVSKL